MQKWMPAPNETFFWSLRAGSKHAGPGETRRVVVGQPSSSADLVAGLERDHAVLDLDLLIGIAQ